MRTLTLRERRYIEVFRTTPKVVLGDSIDGGRWNMHDLFAELRVLLVSGATPLHRTLERDFGTGAPRRLTILGCFMQVGGRKSVMLPIDE